MNFIETLLSEELENKNPMLDILCSDRKMLQIACQDLTNYLKVKWNLVGKEANECELVEKLEEIHNKEQKELQVFIDIWTGIWLKKWNERVKLLIGNDGSEAWKKMVKILKKGEPLWKRFPNREMQEMVIATLIKNGEICGTSILAENLLKMELGENKRKYINKEEKVLSVVNNALRKARELSRSKGPLIFVKINKAYYQH